MAIRRAKDANSNVIGSQADDFVSDLYAGANRTPEVTLHSQAQPGEILHRDRLIQAVLVSEERE